MNRRGLTIGVGLVLQGTSLVAGTRLDTAPEHGRQDTGGVVLTIATGDDLGSSFRRVLDDFRASYVLYFSPHGVRGGGLHTLDVRVKRDGVDVRARRAYVWHPDQAKAVPSDCNGIARVANRTLTAINSPSRTRDPPTIGTGRSRNC